MLKSVKKVWRKIFKEPCDPLKILPPAAMDKVLKHVRGSDLIMLSMVSKDWYTFIAQSPVCMDKIRVHVTEYFFSNQKTLKVDDVFKIIDGGREYVQITLACVNPQLSPKLPNFTVQHKMLMGSFHWKSINLCNHTFDDEIEFLSFLAIVEPSVEELELRSVKIKSLEEVGDSNLRFPKLKILKLANVDNFIYSAPFKNVFKLKTLHVATEPFKPAYLDNSDLIHNRSEAIAKLMLNNRDIEVLELFIDQKDFDWMFLNKNFVSRLTFSVRKLAVGRFEKITITGSNSFQINNFSQFLRLHADTLKEISLQECLGAEFLEVVMNEMTSLATLTLPGIEAYEKCGLAISKMHFKVNPSIQELNISCKNFKSCNDYVNFLSHLPNLKRFNTCTISQLVLNTLLGRNLNLESIIVDYFAATYFPDGMDLETLRQMIITTGVSDQLIEQVESKRQLNNFEKVFLAAALRLKQKWDVDDKSLTKKSK